MSCKQPVDVQRPNRLWSTEPIQNNVNIRDMLHVTVVTSVQPPSTQPSFDPGDQFTPPKKSYEKLTMTLRKTALVNYPLPNNTKTGKS